MAMVSQKLRVSAKLASFLGVKENAKMTRAQVVKKVWEHIKRNKLQVTYICHVMFVQRKAKQRSIYLTIDVPDLATSIFTVSILRLIFIFP